MKKNHLIDFCRRIHYTLLFFGFNLLTLKKNIEGLGWYLPHLYRFLKQKKNIKGLRLNIQLQDKSEQAGDIHSHYFWQDLLVAKAIILKKIDNHYDIGSRIDGFIGHLLSADVQVNVFDIRPLESQIENLKFKKLDLTKDIPLQFKSSCNSLSCLHTIEHFGLGRYGDQIDVNGHLKGIIQIKQLIAPGGNFYLSFPVGKEKTYFNAHRVINPVKFFQEQLHDDFEIEKFMILTEKCSFKEFDHRDFLEYDFDNHSYSCGIYFLKRKHV